MIIDVANACCSYITQLQRVVPHPTIVILSYGKLIIILNMFNRYDTVDNSNNVKKHVIMYWMDVKLAGLCWCKSC